MREKLKGLDKNGLQEFQAIFVKLDFYKRSNWDANCQNNHTKIVKHPTILVRKVCDKNGKILTKHAWLNIPDCMLKYAKTFRSGDPIVFSAYVDTYIKGNWNSKNGREKKLQLDYGFANVNIRKPAED